MELFSISCTTCKTRLKVRDAAAIGKLLDCPKCGAFVLIEAPPGWSAGQASGGAAGQPAALPTGTLAAQIGSSVYIVPPPPPAESTFDDAAALLSDAPAAREATFAAAAPTAAPPAGQFSPETPPHEAAPEAAESVSDVASSAEPALPQWLLMGGAAVAGVMLAMGLFVLAVWIFSGGENDAALAAGPDRSLPLETPDDDQDAAEPNEKAETPKPDPATKKPEPLSGPPAKPGSAAKEPTASDKPKEPQKRESPEPKPDSTKGEVSAEPEPAKTVDPKTVSGAIDKFSKFLDDPPSPADESPAEATDKPVEPEPAGPSSEESIRPRPEPRKIDVTARLADKLASIEFQAVPLSDFAQFITDFSTLPVTLDPEALQFAGAAPDKPVTVKLRDASTGTIVKEALAPLGLGYAVTPAGLVVGRAAPEDGKLRTSTYSVADLGGNDAERLAGLAELAAAVVAPESWEPAGGPGTLTPVADKQALSVQNGEAVHFQMLLFCEKLRVARGLSPRSKFDKSLFRLDPRAGRADSKLATPITLNFSQPAPLPRILDRLGKAAGVRILVDWQAVAAAGWSPEGEGTVVADKLSLGDTLTALLRPMDLAYRVVDDNLLQVTTPRVIEARLELEFHPVADLLSDKLDAPRLVERVKASLGDELFPESGPGGAIRFDEAGKCLLVSLPPPKQAELVKLLAEWRGAK